MRLVVVGIFVLVFSGLGIGSSALAQSASADCAKSKSHLSRAVGEFPELLELEQRIQAQYAAVRGQLSDDGDQDLENGQREWLAYARLLCTEDGQVRSTPFGKSDLNCLAAIYQERLDALGRNQEIEGHLFYAHDRYLVRPDPYPDSYQPTGTLHYSEIRMGGATELAGAYNAFARSGFGERGVRSEQVFAGFDGSTERYAIVEIVDVNNRRISSLLANYVYSHGAAHGNNELLYAHFLVDEMRALEAADIFDAPDWVARLDAMVLPLVDALFEEDFDWGITTLASTVSNPASWNFTPDGLEIQFQSYEVGPYVIGAPSVTVPWSDLRGVLTEGAMEIALGN